MNRKFLWQRDSPKAKDWPAGKILEAARPAVFPERIKLDRLIPGILDQESLGSCAANAVAQALRAAMVHFGATTPTLASRLFLYYFARAMDATTQVDAGTSIRSILDVIRKLGFCPEFSWLYDDGPDKFKLSPSSAAVRSAFDQLGGLGYFRIDSTGAQRVCDVRTANAAGYTVVFGTEVSNKFAEFKPDSAPLDPPSAGETILGGHALLAAGYDTDFIWIVNSWGLDYGINGWLKMTDAYIADDCSADFWIIETAPNFLEAL
jgi:C1A family cysteine protease